MTARIARRGALALPALLLAGGALAQPAPRAGTLRLLAGFPAGGTVDTVSRLVAERLRGGHAANVIVENRVGAAGRLAVEAARAAEADGSVALVTPASMLTIYPHIYSPAALRYDPFTDLAPVSPVCLYPFGLAVGPGVPNVTDLRGYLDWARGRGETPYASPAAGSAPHFLGVRLAERAGIRLNHTPYRGAAPAIQDALGGHIPATINVIGDQVPHHRDGRLRILAVTSRERLPQLADVPTVAEAGFPELTAEEWFGVFLPARAPAEAVSRLNAALAAVAADPAMREALGRLEMAPAHATPQEFAATLRREHEGWGPVVRASGFTAEG